MRTMTILAAGVLLATLAGSAEAGVVTLGADTNAIPGWHGSRYYEELFVSNIAVRVEYAVYAPGTFDDSFPGQDPSGGMQYVYAYQLFNNLSPHPSGSPGYVTAFSVGLTGPDGQAANIGFVDGDDWNPTSQWLSPAAGPYDTAFWEFSGTQLRLNYGKVSDVLIFTSPFEPELDNASATGKWGFGDTELLPSPIPEPAVTLVLLAGALGLLRRSGRRA